MSEAKILVVDDQPLNVELLANVLSFKGYSVVTANGGREALEKVANDHPDLLLLDVVMPDMSGYDVCRSLRGRPESATLPIVMVTALDPVTERINGIEAGADDFLTKPINQAELLARVRSLLKMKRYHDTVQAQAKELQEWASKLELRVREQVAQLDALGRLKGFFSSNLAEAIVSGGADELLKPHRREVTCVFLDIRGFTAFSEGAEPEEIMEFLHGYHNLVGNAVIKHRGTIERFAGDGMMIFFNDPIPLPNAPELAVCTALEVQQAFGALRDAWHKRGYSLGLGCGITTGYATLGAIGFEGRRDYAVIGRVSNLAARLCSEARPGQILTNQKTAARLESGFVLEPAGEITLKGIMAPVLAFNISGIRSGSSVISAARDPAERVVSPRR